ncbi:hypothetical protein ACIBVL_43145, partial [Streptomyces sp. NPDC049687]
GKALVAWDEWGKNPGRAAGAVTFNVLTTVFTGGAGGAAAGAGKAGAVAKALSVAGKAGKIIDPMTYVAKGAGAGLSKIGDVTKALKGIGNIEIPKLPDNAITLPEGSVRLPDGTVHLPEGAAIPEGATRLPDGNVRLPEGAPGLPEGSVRLPTEAGAPARYYDPPGNLLDENGNVLKSADQAPKEPGGTPQTGTPGAGSDIPHTPTPVREPALVGAGAHTAETAGQHISLGNSLDTNLGDLGRVPDNAAVHAGGDLPTVHAGGDVPTVHAGGDLPRTGMGDHLPGGSAGDHLPGGSAHEHGPGPSAGHEPPSGHSDGQGTHSGDGPGTHHDGPTGPHEQPGAAGHGHESGNTPGGNATGGQGEGPGGPGPGHEPEKVDYREGDEQALQPTGRMQPDQEAAVAEQLARSKMAPHDIEKSLVGLRKSEYGAGIAKYISDGKLAHMPGYDELLSQCKQVSRNNDMSPAVYMAMEHAAELQARGVKGLAFEWKVPGDGLDLDVLVRSGNRIEYGAQLKDVSSASSLNSATRGIAEKQLLGNIDGQKVAILDVHDTKLALTDKILGRIAHRARITNATFVLRFKDGSITIPANGPTYP